MATPEGVTLEVTLAGVGSRFVAGLVDQILRTALLVSLVVLLTVAAHRGGLSGGVLEAVLIVAVFLVQFAYDVLFETLASGRTPGKRWTGLRVVRAGGAPVGFVASALRNLLRVIDSLPGFYLVGIIAVMVTRNNQRLGDLAAGTVVVRERHRSVALPGPVVPAPGTPDAGQSLWDVSTVSAEELATVRRFLDRRATLSPAARDRLALEMANRLGPKVVGPPRDWEAEAFLEYVVAAKQARQ